MKILISNDGTHAHFFQRMSWLNAFKSCGFTVGMWDCKNVPAFDVFDQFEPDIFLGQSYNLDEALIKCIYERPHLKVGLRAGDWGDHEKEIDKSKYNILFASEKEKHILKKLKDETGKPDFVHIHYEQKNIDITHSRFNEIGIDAKSIMMCADANTYGDAKYNPTLDCDIGFVGGYWPYKGLVIREYLFQLLECGNDYRIKIFGNQPWPANQYCGYIDDEEVKDLFISAKICPNLSEPHAQKFGIDVNERIFKVLYAGGFCVSDYVESYKSLFGDGVVLCKSPEDFQAKIKFFLENDEERMSIAKKGKSIVETNHTNFHRIATILGYFGLHSLEEKILNDYSNYLQQRPTTTA